MIYKNINLECLDKLKDDFGNKIEVDAAKSYIEHRINKKKPLTQRAFNQAMAKALNANKVGMTPTELIDWTVEHTGWDGINISWTKGRLAAEAKAERESVSNSVRDVTIEEQLTDRSWAHQTPKRVDYEH